MMRVLSGVRRQSSSTGKESVFTPRTAAAAAAGATHKLFGSVPLNKRIANHIENTHLGMVIDVLSALLSLLTVFTYMAETYRSVDDPAYIALRSVDLACSCIFAAEWVFWLWLAQDKLSYVLSVQSCVDVITIIPLFLALFISIDGFSTFQSMVRFARVLRVYRIFRLGPRVQSEVAGRLMTLVFTLLAIIFTGAAFFYEIESRFSNAYPDLTFARCLYWSMVTVTTIGYGDISPSITASQMMLLGMLVITFTLLPLQTSELVNAFQHSSAYQRAAYRQQRKGRHVVIMGSFDADSARQIIGELYHADYGFQDCTTVFLSSQAPDEGMRALLKTHRLSQRLMYVQGNPMMHKDLERIQVQHADAVFILCSKQPLNALQEDTTNIMALLSVGHYMHSCQRQAANPKVLPVHKQVELAARRLLRRLHQINGRQPHVFLQLTLPESRDRVSTTLDALTDAAHRSVGTPPDVNPHVTSKPLTTSASLEQQHHDAQEQQQGQKMGLQQSKLSLAAWPGAETNLIKAVPAQGIDSIAPAGASAPKALLNAANGHKSPVDDNSAGSQNASLVRQQAGAPKQPISFGTNSLPAGVAPAIPGHGSSGAGDFFWQRFVEDLSVVCVTELKQSLLAHSCLTCPGIITLLSNLVKSVDSTSMTQQEFECQPMWLQEYLEGTSNEIYEVRRFPAHLVGRSYATVARYAYEGHHAILLGVGTSMGGRQELCLAPVGQVIQPGAAGYVIAADLRVAMDIVEADAAEFEAWLHATREAHADLQTEQPLQQQGQHDMVVAEVHNVHRQEDSPHANGSAAFPGSQFGSSSGEASTGQRDVHTGEPANSTGRRPGQSSSLDAASSSKYLPASTHTTGAAWPSLGELSAVAGAQQQQAVALRDKREHSPAASNSSHTRSSSTSSHPPAHQLSRHSMGYNRPSLAAVFTASRVSVTGSHAATASGTVKDATKPSVEGVTKQQQRHHARTTSGVALSMAAVQEQQSLGSSLQAGLLGTEGDCPDTSHLVAAGSAAIPAIPAAEVAATQPGAAAPGTAAESRSSSAAAVPALQALSSAADAPGSGNPWSSSLQGVSWRVVNKLGSLPAAAAAATSELGSAALGTAGAAAGGVASGLATAAGAAEAWMVHSKRRQRAAIQYNARQVSLPTRHTRRLQDAHGPTSSWNSAGSRTRHMLTQASRKSRDASAFLQQHYIVHQQHDAAASICAKDMMRQQVDVHGHVLICGNATSPEAMFALLAPFRSRRLNDWRPIVILDKPVPCGPLWDHIARFKDMYFVEGSVHNSHDLERANAAAAVQAIVLPAGSIGSMYDGGTTALERGTLADADVIFACRLLHSFNRDMEVVTELVLPHDVQYLDTAGALVHAGDISPHTTPAFMSGMVLLAEMIDSLTCQSLYNRASDSIIPQLLHNWHSGSPSSSHSSDSNADQHAIMIQVPVDALRHSTFDELFVHLLLQHRMLCLGLYRPVEHMGQVFSYVFTNPDPWTQLQEGDRAMVLHTLQDGPGAAAARLPDDACGFEGSGTAVVSGDWLPAGSPLGHIVACEGSARRGVDDSDTKGTQAASVLAALDECPTRAAPSLPPLQAL